MKVAFYIHLAWTKIFGDLFYFFQKNSPILYNF